MFKKITYAFLLALACHAHAAEDNVLLWFYNDPAIREVDGGSVYAEDLVGRGGDAEGKTVNAVRISVTDGDGNKVYLNLTDLAGAGTPRDTWQSWMALPDDDGDFFAGPGYADLSGLSLSATGLSFAMELGNYSKTGDDVDWIVLAGSANSTLGELVAGGHIVASELSYEGSKHWRGAAYAVPEPTSGLLVLIGGALLALRRRRKDIAA